MQPPSRGHDELSMRCWIAGLSPLSRRLTASTNRKRYGARTDPRSTRWPGPTCIHRSGSSTRNGAWSSLRDAATGQPSTSQRSIWPCLRWRTEPRSMPGRLPWSGRCALQVPGCSSRSPRRRREDHRHAGHHPGLDPRRRPGTRPRPVRGRRRSAVRARPITHRSRQIAARRRPIDEGGRV
jgi:hypothetical protein